ncbi:MULTISPECIES: DUF4180 domain-containing protein [unclassified Streptomyces]|uniref:DUF4180 domain-containing protein n=1 Tax=unclassified Streptomyces TaxID=2593676 RepID=UPI00224F1F3C|nr:MULTISPECIES: DUF4180 domain-containing protein [unclassified Streptomyces]MCX4878400.1 DUF4180 domain-containing protein [Streptomyces sp. NBC_00847]MCX5418414.1 DUF4180 domain-containing protein [Streptomyces sp. NBC_00078]
MTTNTVETIHGVRVLRGAFGGPPLDGERAALDLIGDAMGHDAELVVLPVERVADEFFRLSSGIAGAVMQKFVNYRVRLAVVGDISRLVADSTALRDFVHETNQGAHIWFLADDDALGARLRPAG